MKLLKIKLLIIAVIMLAASSAFASLSTYDVTINTTSLSGQSGYLYLQYATLNNAVASTATVSSFTTDGVLGAQDTVDVADGAAVNGTLPGSVVFANTNAVNDYNHAITFGSTISFILSLSNPTTSSNSGVSTFSLGLFADALGSTPLLNTGDPNIAGTGILINLNNNGTTSAQSLDSNATATPTPIPAAAWLLGSGLMGLFGMRKKTQV
jgi:hypothetical protein